MKTIYMCEECGEEFGSIRACRKHEASHKMNIDMAMAVLKQADLNNVYGHPCEHCPRKDKRCADCLNKARDIVLAVLKGLLEDNKVREEQSRQ